MLYLFKLMPCILLYGAIITGCLIPGLSSVSFCCCDKHKAQSSFSRKKVYLAGYSPSSRAAKAGIHGRSWSRDPGGYCFQACLSQCFSDAAQAHFPRMAPLTLGWTLPDQSAVKKCPKTWLQADPAEATPDWRVVFPGMPRIMSSWQTLTSPLGNL